jgi:hypothetical protein
MGFVFGYATANTPALAPDGFGMSFVPNCVTKVWLHSSRSLAQPAFPLCFVLVHLCRL